MQSPHRCDPHSHGADCPGILVSRPYSPGHPRQALCRAPAPRFAWYAGSRSFLLGPRSEDSHEHEVGDDYEEPNLEHRNTLRLERHVGIIVCNGNVINGGHRTRNALLRRLHENACLDGY